MEKRIKIFASYHAEALRIKNDVFEPIQIGRDVFGYTLDGMLSENTGDNISHKQPIYSDLVTSYWLLKNYIDTCDEDYIGVCHYRRAFSFKRPMTWRNIKEKIKCDLAVYLMPFRDPGSSLTNWNAHYVYDDTIFLEHIAQFTKDIKADIQSGKHDIYGMYPVKHSGVKFGLLFDRVIGAANVDLFKEILQVKYPQYYDAFKENYNSLYSYYGNIYIMRKDIFKQYNTILFDLLFTHEELAVQRGLMIDPNSEKLFARGEGFLAEFMLSTFIRYHIQNDRNRVKLMYGVFNNIL